MRMRASRSFVLSAVGVTAAALLCAVALARALTVEPTAAMEATPTGVASLPEAGDVPPARVPSEGVLELESLALAVDHDPFMPDRRRAARYRLPGESVERPAVIRREEPEPPPFRVIGTAMSGESGIALVELLEGGAPEVVKVGGSLLGYRLRSVDTESATLERQSRTIRLAVQSGSAGVSTRGRAAASAELTEAMQRYQAVVDRLREGGMSAELIGQLLGGQRDGAELRLFGVTPQGRAGRGGRANIGVRRDTLWSPQLAPQK